MWPESPASRRKQALSLSHTVVWSRHREPSGDVLGQCTGLFAMQIPQHQPKVLLQTGLSKDRSLRPARLSVFYTLLKKCL